MWYFLLHNMGIFEMIPQSPCALDTSVCEGANLFAIESAPFFAIEFMIKRLNEFGMDEIDESIPNITSIVIVDGQIEEVKFHFEVFVELF